jgi:hypothetical protein
VQRFGEWLRKEKLVIGIAVLFSLFSFSAGLSMVHYDLGSGKAMMDAAAWLKNNTENNSYIISENYPVINYVSGRNVFMFPRNLSSFDTLVNDYNITYCLVDNWEPSTPEYATNLSHPLVARFESNGQIVLIYRLST